MDLTTSIPSLNEEDDLDQILHDLDETLKIDPVKKHISQQQALPELPSKPKSPPILSHAAPSFKEFKTNLISSQKSSSSKHAVKEDENLDELIRDLDLGLPEEVPIAHASMPETLLSNDYISKPK
jgi:hypothetical protein